MNVGGFTGCLSLPRLGLVAAIGGSSLLVLGLLIVVVSFVMGYRL